VAIAYFKKIAKAYT
jgi:hypothetical protein